MTQTSYQIKLKNQSGALVALFVGAGRSIGPAQSSQGGLQSFNYWKRLRTAGSFAMNIDGTDDRVSLFERDSQIEIERRDTFTGGGFVKVFEGLVRFFEYSELQDGRLVFEVRGRQYNDLLIGESIFYPVGSSQSSKSGAAETVAKSYVNQNIGPGAGVDDEGNTRVRAGLTIQADAATGSAWTGDRAGSNLLDVLIEIADFTGADFGVFGNGAAAYEFRWFDGQLGTDKRRGTANPVIFGTRRGNVERVTLVESYLNEANVVYALGGGAGVQRVRVTRSNATSLALSPIGRRAVMRDASDEVTTAGLNARADDVLEALRQHPKVSFDIKQSIGTRFVRDWDVGDLVTVEVNKAGTFVDVDQKIIGARVSVLSSGEENIGVETDDI